MSRKCANQPLLEQEKLADVTLRLADGKEYLLRGACVAGVELSEDNVPAYWWKHGRNWAQRVPFPGKRKKVRCTIELVATDAQEIVKLKRRKR